MERNRCDIYRGATLNNGNNVCFSWQTRTPQSARRGMGGYTEPANTGELAVGKHHAAQEQPANTGELAVGKHHAAQEHRQYPSRADRYQTVLGA
ncbi:MAG: hypothetical protein ACXADB_14015 [Candidatus Hermodarchaeia archaeon]